MKIEYKYDVFELDTDKLAVKYGSSAYKALLKAGWFTWEMNDDGDEAIMTRPKSGVKSYKQVLK